MTTIIILIGIIIVFFLGFTFARKIDDVSVLIAVAIGCAVNANIFTSISTPIVVGKVTFGIDAILYTLFMFTIIIRLIDYSIKDAQIMTLTSIVAILISALIEYVTYVTVHKGFILADLLNFLKYIASTFGTFLAVWVIQKIYLKLEKLKAHKLLTIFILISIGSLINAIWLYGFHIVVDGLSENALSIFVGSVILRFISIIFAQISMVIYYRFLKKE